MKIALRSHHTTLAELNITPLLDLVFVLLVIFIITTPQLMNNLELALPSGKTDSPKPAEPAHIRVTGRNQIQLDSLSLTRDEFKTALAQRKAAQPGLSVIVEGTDTANYQSVVDVLETLQQLEISQVGLATTPNENPALPPP
jgi:biopolymer transport protein ExbD